jgi:cell division protein FtsL
VTPPAATAAARHRSAAAPARPAPRTRPQAPRRKPIAVPRPARRDLPLGARALGWLRTLPDHRLVDRLIGGRVWIVLIGTLLVGIVTMQLTLLKLNAGIGRAVEQSTVLQQANAALAATDSQLSDPQRVVDLAQQQLGMVTPPQGSPRFISTAPGDAGSALANMRVPSPTAPAIPAAATTTTSPTAPAGTMTSVSQTTTTAGATTTGTTGTTATTTPAATTTAPATGTGTTTGTGATTPSAGGGGTSAATAPSTGAGTATAGGAAPQG